MIYSKGLYAEQCRLHLEDDKGTSGKISDRTKEDIIKEILLKLGGILIPFKMHGEGWKAVCDSILRHARDVAKEGRLCKFYIIWKLHKMANAAGIRTRPIAAAINYITGPASPFLHYQLLKEVWKQNKVLKDSLDLIRELETARFRAVSELRLTTAGRCRPLSLYPA